VITLKATITDFDRKELHMNLGARRYVSLGVAMLLFSAPNARAGDLFPPAGAITETSRFGPRKEITHLPVTIDSSGSYYLGSNFDSTLGGITVSASNVTIDLAGWSLLGGTGTAILANAGTRNITLKDGSISAWSGDGADLSAASGCLVENVIVQGCTGGHGIRIGNNGIVRNCISSNQTNGSGIFTGEFGVVTACVGYNNSINGIQVGSGSTVSGCTAADNANRGIEGLNTATIVNCSSIQNTGFGIAVGSGGTVSQCSLRTNALGGITTLSGCTVKDCTVQSSGTSGIAVTSNCQVVGNNCSGSTNGILVSNDANCIKNNCVSTNTNGILILGASNLMIRNMAFENTANYPAAAPGNHVGDLISSPGDTFGATNPWANFSL
jgi:hypothetical protein